MHALNAIYLISHIIRAQNVCKTGPECLYLFLDDPTTFIAKSRMFILLAGGRGSFE